MYIVFCYKVDYPKESQQVLSIMKRNFAFRSQFFKYTFVFFENPERNFDMIDFFDERVVCVFWFFQLHFNSIKELLLGKVTNMSHHIFYFDSCAHETFLIHCWDFYRLADDGASSGNIVLSILLI